MLICLTIFSTFIFFATPAISQWQAHNRQRITSEQYVQALNYARQYAITNNKSVRLCPTQDNKACRHDGIWQGDLLLYAAASINNASLNPIHYIQITDKAYHIASSRRLNSLQVNQLGHFTANTTLTFCDKSGGEASFALVVFRTRLRKESKAIQCSP